MTARAGRFWAKVRNVALIVALAISHIPTLSAHAHPGHGRAAAADVAASGHDHDGCEQHGPSQPAAQKDGCACIVLQSHAGCCFVAPMTLAPAQEMRAAGLAPAPGHLLAGRELLPDPPPPKTPA